MNIFRVAVFAASFLFASPALAQWQTPNHSAPIGRGAGVTGFGSAAPGATGIPLTSNGASSDPTFHPATNAGIAPGAANTLKGSLDGTTTTDIAVPACTDVGKALQWVAGTGPQCNAVSVFTGFDMPVNMGLSASSNGTALTFTLTTAAGATPTTASPVLVPFRSTTMTAGTVAWRTITSTLTMTIPSGATLGASSTVPFRLWLFMEDNGGTPELAVAMCSNVANIFPCTAWEYTGKTSIVLDAAADSAGVLYAPTAVASDAVRIIGFCNFSGGLATAGTWASSCTNLQLMGPGIKKPGDVVQTIRQTVALVATGTGVIPDDDSVPQISEGSQFMSQAITPTTAVNILSVEAQGAFANSGANVPVAMALFQDAAVNALAVSRGNFPSGAGVITSNYLEWSVLAGSAVATTFTIRAGGSSASTTTFNGTAGAQRYNGTMNSFIKIREIMGALPEPANDNVHPGVFSKVG